MRKTTLLSMFGTALLLAGVGCTPSQPTVPANTAVNTNAGVDVSGNVNTNAPATPPVSTLGTFNTAITFSVGDTATFTDGLTVKLEKINDSRCPEDVQCVWAGELAAEFVIGGNVETATVLLSESRGNRTSTAGHTFELGNVTETTADLTVILDAAAAPGAPGAPGASTPTVAEGECRPTGCSGQICSDQDMASDCMYRPEYACYGIATCARQANGECGWTQTEELTACLANPPSLEPPMM